MQLANVSRGVVDQPDHLLVYGTEGVGKTSLAAQAPGVVFLPVEKGTNQLDVARFPKPETWIEVFEAIEELLRDEGHGFKTLAIDTLDALEGILWQHLCRENKVRTIEEVGGGFGKGFVAALEQWRVLARRLDELREKRGIRTILVAHAHVKAFHAPDQESFDRYTLKMNDKASAFWREWSDAVLFCNYDTATLKTKTGRVRGVSTDERWIYTTRTAAFDAKNRRNLPASLSLSWDELSAAMSRPVNLDELRAEIDALLPHVPEATHASISAVLPRAAGDAGKLSYLLNLARTKAVRAPAPETTP